MFAPIALAFEASLLLIANFIYYSFLVGHIFDEF